MCQRYSSFDFKNFLYFFRKVSSLILTITFQDAETKSVQGSKQATPSSTFKQPIDSIPLNTEDVENKQPNVNEGNEEISSSVGGDKGKTPYGSNIKNSSEHADIDRNNYEDVVEESEGESCNIPIFNIILLIYLLDNISIIIISSHVDCLTLLFLFELNPF